MDFRLFILFAGLIVILLISLNSKEIISSFEIFILEPLLRKKLTKDPCFFIRKPKHRERNIIISLEAFNYRYDGPLFSDPKNTKLKHAVTQIIKYIFSLFETHQFTDHDTETGSLKKVFDFLKDRCWYDDSDALDLSDCNFEICGLRLIKLRVVSKHSWGYTFEDTKINEVFTVDMQSNYEISKFLANKRKEFEEAKQNSKELK